MEVMLEVVLDVVFLGLLCRRCSRIVSGDVVGVIVSWVKLFVVDMLSVEAVTWSWC